MSGAAPQRSAELVLVHSNGALIGKLPPVPAGTPWWPEVETVVRAVREWFGIDVTILRLLRAERPRMPGGRVTYLAETSANIECEPFDGELDDHLLRNSYARVGGPRADLEWARASLAQANRAVVAPPVQIKTWNLSSLWRLPLDGQDAWLKSVPQFFGHEGALIKALAPSGCVPHALAHEHGRLVMSHIPGVDLFDATQDQRRAMIDVLVTLQRDWAARVEVLLALGLPDWRAAVLIPAIENAFERTRDELHMADVRVIERFIGGLDKRFNEIDACGIPDSLVHGDFHPGNVRGDELHLTILDWGDAGVGHPLLDVSAFMDRARAGWRSSLRDHWLARWRTAYPESDPARAWQLISPIAVARQAVIYLRFLDNIEPAEHPYHRDDPRESMQRVGAILASRAA